MPTSCSPSNTPQLLERVSLGGANYELRLRVDAPEGPAPRAGQFAMLRPSGPGSGVFLSRPLSFLDSVTLEDGAWEQRYYIKVAGPGTAALVDLEPGAELTLLAPLGRSIEEALVELEGAAGAKAPLWLVGGGVGIAPVAHLLFERERGRSDLQRPVRVFYGGRGRVDLPFLEELEPRSELVLSTDDGSVGHHGRVTEPLVAALDALSGADPRPILFACGPTPMMAAVAGIARDRGLRCLVSLETRMACGYGVCLGCTVHVEGHGYERACVEGPVFDASRLNFEERWL